MQVDDRLSLDKISFCFFLIFLEFLSKNVHFSLAFLPRKDKMKSDFIPHLSQDDESY